MELKLSRRTFQNKYAKITIIGLVVHVLLVLAAFDLYFSSPLDHGMTPIKTTENPPAKRVVLFVADGLRSEAIFNVEEVRTPFLTGILQNNGSWGVSHTRVPTESRPGHVALLGGIYEDPSALFKGWKHNPVNFDSVVNQSTNAFCWGSPDICYLFNTDNLPHIHMDSYEAEMQDFGKKNPEILDEWVFDKVKKSMNKLKKCNDCSEYYQQGNLFFLHLLGIDTAGHAFKPQSKEYINNIKMVDKNIQTMYNLFEETFQDKSTAYIFTSDHGMTNWGSHGSGSEHETDTPLITWGAGIKIDKERKDIHQIDMAPLISSLMGKNLPINSLGKLPYKYLDTTKQNIAKMLISNVLQLLEILNVKRIRVFDNSIFYVPYKDMSTDYFNDMLLQFQSLYNAAKYDDVVNLCQSFMKEIVLGIDYYHYYYQRPLLVSVTIGFLCWIIILLVSIVAESYKKPYRKKPFYPILSLLCLFTVILCYKHKFPLTYYIHFLFPVVTSFILYQELHVMKQIFKTIKKVGMKPTLFNVAFYLIGLELLVFGFTYRWSYSLLMVLVGFWMVYSLRNNITVKDRVLWLGCSIILAIFPALPVMYTTFNINLYLYGAACWFFYFFDVFSKLHLYNYMQGIKHLYLIFALQMVSLVSAVIYMLYIEFEIIPSDSNVKYLPWVISITPIALIPEVPKLIHIRLMSIFFGFAPYFLFVTSNFEGFFLLCFTVLLHVWLLVESKNLQKDSAIYFTKFDTIQSTEQNLNADVFRRGFLFMVFIFVGFFGMGNIASINSFDPMWVRSFLTVFSPFKMMILILFKVVIPFLFACCVFRAINIIAKENMLSMFCIILVFSDVMVLQSLYLITNKGSWLDIGTSLSHFLIMEGFVTIILLLYSFSQLLTDTSYVF